MSYVHLTTMECMKIETYLELAMDRTEPWLRIGTCTA